MGVFLTILYFFSYFSVGFLVSITGPTKRGLRELIFVSDDIISIIFICRGIGGVVGNIICGPIFNIQYKNLNYINFFIVISLLVNSISLVIVGLVHDLWSYYICHAFTGIANSFIVCGCILAILRLFKTGNKQTAFLQGINASFGVGGILSFIITIIYGSSSSKTMNIMFIYSFAALLSFIPVPFFIFNYCLQCKDSKCGNNQERSNFVEKTGEKEISTAENFRKPHFILQYIVTIVLCFMVMFVCFVEINFYSLISTFIFTKGLANESISALISSCYFIGYTISRIFVTVFFLITTMQPYFLMFFCFCGLVFSFVVTLVFSEDFYLLWIYSIIVGVFISPIGPSSYSITHLFNFVLNGFQTGIIILGSSFGVFVPFFVNYTMNNVFGSNAFIYWNLTFVCVGFFVFLCVVLFGLIFREQTKQKQKSSDSANNNENE